MKQGELTGQQRLAFSLILLLAIALRIAALIPPSIHHPDEIFQYLEPAHRLIFGQGIVTWEYRYGMRSWLLPLLLAGPMWLGNLIDPNSTIYLFLPRLFVSLTSLLIPLSAFCIGRRMSVLHGLLAMLVTATWFETVYFSAHTITETVATSLFIAGAAIMLSSDRPKPSSLIASGLLLSLACIMRFHYGPAIALFGLWQSAYDFKRKWPLLFIGIILALVISISTDLAMGGRPFGWVLENIHQNLLQDKAARYGVSPFLSYFSQWAGWWRWALPFLLVACLPVITAHRSLFAAALLNIVIHTLIGHKEYRFIQLSVTILVVLAAIGSVEWANRVKSLSEFYRRVLLTMVIFGWLAFSSVLAFSGPMAHRWTAFRPELSLTRLASSDPHLCGFAVHDLFWSSGGYTWLHRDVPTYLTYWDDQDRVTRRSMGHASAAFNAILAPASLPPNAPGWSAKKCDSGMCLFVRAGECDPKVAKEWQMQTVLQRHDS